jgi:hypothetical protein
VKVGFRESFSKDLAGIKDKSLLERVRVAIEAVEKAGSLSQINGLKKLKRRRKLLPPANRGFQGRHGRGRQ